jgi:hypothetical protein
MTGTRDDNPYHILDEKLLADWQKAAKEMRATKRRFKWAMAILILAGLIFVASGIVRAVASPYDDSVNHKLDAKWQKTLEKAARLSVKQNHGHADLEHTCYAEDNKAFCATVITYRNTTGDLAFVRVIRRGEDNSVFARDICQFNKNKTLRTCINFDNGYTSKWAEDKNGDWQQIDREVSDDDAAGGGL